MTRYTIGALFTPSLDEVVLIEKQRPQWQKGRLNFPGGHIEEGETSQECMIREFEEETGIKVSYWFYIGRIVNDDNYQVDFFTTVCDKRELSNPTDEKCNWYNSNNLPKNIISNLSWLVPFAKNTLAQGNYDTLIFGTFKYSNI